MFRFIRFQIVHPCRAKCAWCVTHKKNPLFRQLLQSGIADQIHQFYLDALDYFRPEEVFLSGGEPLLLPGIEILLQKMSEKVKRINLFTSYQWSAGDLDRMKFDQMPLSKIVFTHTPIFFEKEKWNELTKGFPFEVYLKNIRSIASLKAKKRFKFILNHENFVEEVDRFHDYVQPDDRFELSFKLINDQGDGLMRSSMKETRELINKRIRSLEELEKKMAWGEIKRKYGSLETLAHLLDDGDVSRCPFRHKANEVRFALDPKVRKNKAVLRYRYCPYFPPQTFHRFHVGKDSLKVIEKNFLKASFHQDCSKCRFLLYYRA